MLFRKSLKTKIEVEETPIEKYTTPVVASLIMSLESVFAAITGWLFLNEVLSLNETIGCVLIFTAIIISQIEFKKPNKN